MHAGSFNEELHYSQNLQQSRHLQYPEEVLLMHPQYSTSFVLKNVAEHVITYRMVLTNPDNYILAGALQGKLGLDETVTISLQLKLYDSISTFNYENNRIYMLSQAVGSQEKDVSSIGIRVELDGMKVLSNDVQSFMRRHVKVHSDNRPLSAEEEAYLLGLLIHLGELQMHWHCGRSLLLRFYHPVELEPYIIQYLHRAYSVCYQSTLTGKLIISNSTVPSRRQSTSVQTFQHLQQRSKSCFQSTTYEEELLLVPTVSLPVKSDIRGFFTRQQPALLVWHTESKIVFYDVLQQIREKHVHEENFSVRELDGFICVVLEKEIAYFYKSIDKRYAMSFRSIAPNLMALSEDGTLYITEKKHRPNRLSYTHWPFHSQDIEHSKRPAANSGKTVYIYDRFNTRKNSVSPDHKHTFSGCVEVLQVKGRILIVYIQPEIQFYDTKSKQIILKLEKQVCLIRPLVRCHSVNLMNLASLNHRGGVSLFNIDCMCGIFGAEVIDVVEQGAQCIGEGQDGNIYFYGRQKISHYDLRHRKIVASSSIRMGSDKIQRVGLNSDCLVLLKQTAHGSYLQTRYVPDVLGYIV